MSLRAAFDLLRERYEGERGVWLVGLAFGLVLGGSYAAVFVVDAPWATPLNYGLFVVVASPLFGAALWPYAVGMPPESPGELLAESLRRYPRLLGARVGYVVLVAATAGASVAVLLVLGTTVSALTHATGGGATTLEPDDAWRVALVAAFAFAAVGVFVGRLLFGFLDAAALADGSLRGALDEALAVVFRAPKPVATVVLLFAGYQLLLPFVAGFTLTETTYAQFAAEKLFTTPRLLPPGGEPPFADFAEPQTPMRPGLLFVAVVIDVAVTTACWPLVYGYHFTLFETLRSEQSSDPDGESNPGVDQAASDRETGDDPGRGSVAES